MNPLPPPVFLALWGRQFHFIFPTWMLLKIHLNMAVWILVQETDLSETLEIQLTILIIKKKNFHIKILFTDIEKFVSFIALLKKKGAQKQHMVSQNQSHENLTV